MATLEDEPLDNWEDIDENSAALEERLEKLALKKPEPNPSVHQNMPAVVTCEDSSRTPFTSQEPKIMILRRPQANPDQTTNGLINARHKHPVKSLEQRQQEYAQARLRIMGDAGSTEDSKPKPLQQKSLEQREADYAAARLRIMGNTSKSVEEPMVTGTTGGSYASVVKREAVGNNVGVVRAPRGPDGSVGFGRGGGHR